MFLAGARDGALPHICAAADERDMTRWRRFDNRRSVSCSALSVSNRCNTRFNAPECRRNKGFRHDQRHGVASAAGAAIARSCADRGSFKGSVVDFVAEETLPAAETTAIGGGELYDSYARWCQEKGRIALACECSATGSAVFLKPRTFA
jgi:hypothetical protein